MAQILFYFKLKEDMKLMQGEENFSGERIFLNLSIELISIVRSGVGLGFPGRSLYIECSNCLSRETKYLSASALRGLSFGVKMRRVVGGGGGGVGWSSWASLLELPLTKFNIHVAW